MTIFIDSKDKQKPEKNIKQIQLYWLSVVIECLNNTFYTPSNSYIKPLYVRELDNIIINNLN